ncbi:MAG: SPOR domain-containing protein [Candidatus Rokubacteria bacterium]|nr:SPOR domain-containing protein [Candidatus Rokubacteria bacterium]
MRDGRAVRGRGKRGGSTLSGLLFVLACGAVLALTFTLGMLVGRQWARSTASAGLAGDRVAAGGEAPAGEGRTRVRRLSERDRDDAAPQIQEKLTFYQTLTAPLTNGPPPPRRPAAEPPKAAAVPPTRPDPAPEPAAAKSGTPPGGAYTVQVAAFKSRDQADRLREKLGSDAYVSEGGATGVRFRVRVGAYPARAEAEAAMARLRAEHALTGYVTRK